MGLTRTCKKCESNFQITDEDLSFYEKISPTFDDKKYNLLPPTLCPECREQRRWAFRNQSKLYKRKCDFSGEPMISLYSQDKPYKVYKEEIWWSDKWNPMDYGRDFDFSRPFFEQFSELLHAVPRRGMHQDGTNENSDYTTFGMSNKDCYYSSTCFFCENSYYSTYLQRGRSCCDCYICFGSELLYECTDCKNCYNCNFCDNCENCTDSAILDDCRDCMNCIACKNLRKKAFHIYNKPVSKEEFEKFTAALKVNFAEEKAKFDQWKLQLPFISTHIINSENCTGDYMENCKNCNFCFNVFQDAQDCKYCHWGTGAKDAMDCSMAGLKCELLYEVTATAFANTCAFMNFCRNSSNIYYSDCMSACNFCFGCSGLSHKDYCILNKQYTKEEYERLVPQIIEHMKKTGEWGEYFPIEISPFEYKETVAQEYFPL
ncbi:MAG: hypothetical protein WCT53_03615 [Candidatus Gracilibacteria bacterium]